MQLRYSLLTDGLLVYYAAKLYRWQLPQIDFLEALVLKGRCSKPKYSGNCFNCKQITDCARKKCGMNERDYVILGTLLTYYYRKDKTRFPILPKKHTFTRY
jgi:hypothetical protein